MSRKLQGNRKTTRGKEKGQKHTNRNQKKKKIPLQNQP